MARPKKQQWPIGGEPKAAASMPRIRTLPTTVAMALADINIEWFADPKARDKDPAAFEVLSGGSRVDRDFPTLYINEELAALAWWKAMNVAGRARGADETFVWVDPPELIKLQITIMDMRTRTHRVGNDRYVVRSRHAIVKAPAVEAKAA